ncbi:MAG: hypothetical protein OEY14_09735 [Myxococcales bacterium]|nr:hypothetical protein [Myxococcales bacterium]
MRAPITLLAAAAAVMASSLILASPAPASAQPEAEALEDAPALRRACRRAARGGRPELYSITLPAGSWRFGAYEPEPGVLPIDTRRNLRAFGGAVEIFPSGLEPIGLRASAERAAALDAQVSTASLRLGFFLGMDRPARRACLLRPSPGVTMVRFDLAFVELLSESDEVLAREDSDRLRAWADDAERDGVPGSGPRGALSAAMIASGAGTPSEAIQQAIARANAGPLGQALGRCMAAALERGASTTAQVVVRFSVEPNGTPREPEVELSSLGDEEGAGCVAEAVGRHLRLPRRDPREGRLELSVPIRLRGE